MSLISSFHPHTQETSKPTVYHIQLTQTTTASSRQMETTLRSMVVPDHVMKNSNDLGRFFIQREQENTYIYHARRSILTMTRTRSDSCPPSFHTGPSAHYIPTPAERATPMDRTTLDKLPNATRAICGAEKGSTVLLPPLKAPTKPSTPLKGPIPMPRRMSLPADARFDVLKEPTNFKELHGIVNKLAANLTGDNLFRLAHLLKKLNEQDMDNAALFKLHDEWEKYAERAIAETTKIVKDKDDQVRHAQLQTTVLQNSVAGDIVNPNKPWQRKEIFDAVAQNATLVVENEKYRRRIHQLEDEVQQLRDENESMRQQQERSVAADMEARARIGRQNQSRLAKQQNTNAAEQRKLNDRIAELEGQNQALSSHVTETQSQNNDLKGQLDGERVAAKQLQEDNENLAKAYHEKEQALEKKIEDLESTTNEQKTTISSLRDEVELSSSRTLQLQKELDTATALIASLETTLEQTKAEVEKSVTDSKQYKELQRRYSDTRTDHNDLKQKHQNIKSELTSERKKFEAKKKDLERKNKNLSNQVKTLRASRGGKKGGKDEKQELEVKEISE
ncbi:hypothetical protein ONS95_006858 [Cadophora gregata]|uniref:uncharacterized protein n=1 Tax=Cadophora gregata TaxID=51156 RepID=UPI0026DBE3EF|nr:uncharacterized protein ONS95_006858 [Cadophora gregata]KAK0101703.1 hypothetical protein ONS95_006858 [Cadophora gregata]